MSIFESNSLCVFELSAAIESRGMPQTSPNARAKANGECELNFVTLLTLRCFLAAEFGLDEDVDLSVHDFLDVAGLGAGAVIFHHLIRLKNVGTNLVAPRDVAFL